MEVDVVNDRVVMITDELGYLNGFDFGEWFTTAVRIVAWIT